ncbi:aldo/keto reductase [Christensenella sp. MSJ-20]|uniref:aldo/keto reductase n=1 Tax=Christensenella sp. MSJ-20 TaxID=2841518 RepID=UPI000D7ACC82|nr:MAG: aldo/keto reductase [Bacillota bacterium]QWT54639.1 aldo/keto reductase [Christensenella sp. MSJ-20]
MDKVRLGRTGLMVTRTSFGALPIQRDDMDTAVSILRKAYDAGINYFDTARAYTDSEEKIGRALGHVRQNLVISTKTNKTDKAGVLADLEESLRMLKTDYIDVYQLHNIAFLPDPADPDSVYGALLEAKKAGKIRHIGITNHRIDLAMEAVKSGAYETMQFPFCYLSGQREIDLVNLCRETDTGFIAMKALSGGLCGNVPATFCFLRQYENVVPIYGIQHEWELDEFLALDANPPVLDAEMEQAIADDRKTFAGEFCRSCAYCMPCPQGINIPTAARIYWLCTRSPYQNYMTPEFYEEMQRVKDCIHCGACAKKCPFGLDTPALLAKQYEMYMEFYEAHK